MNLYVISGDNHKVWNSRASVGNIEPDHAIPLGAGALGALVDVRQPLLFSGNTLLREEFAHLSVRRTLHSLAYLPLLEENELIGAIEILSFDSPLTEAQLQSLREISELAGQALAAAQAYEDERHGFMQIGCSASLQCSPEFGWN